MDIEPIQLKLAAPNRKFRPYPVIGYLLGGMAGLGAFHPLSMLVRAAHETILNQEFQLQVAALRHHYKSLVIGISGFSSRIKQRIESLEKKDSVCTHLGLKVSLHLLDRMGGRLWVSSQPDRGAAFQIDFPKFPRLKRG